MNENDKYVLMDAVINSNFKGVRKAFKNHFVDFDENYFDYKLLVAAFKRNDGNIISFLLRQTTCRASNPFRVRAEETLLHIVMKTKKIGFIDLLLGKGASFFDTDENGEIPALVGLKSKNYEAVRKLLTLWKPYSRPDNMDYILYFHIACVTNCLPVVEYCLQCGVNPNYPLIINFEEYSNLNPLHYALQNKDYELFHLLLRYGADLSIKNIDGLTALHFLYYANTSKNKCRILKIFESENHTKFINTEDSKRVSHLHVSCMFDNPHIVQAYIVNGADVNSSTSPDCTIHPGFTPLHIAVANYCDKVIELLLQSGADSNKKNKEGQTPLHLACTLSVEFKRRIYPRIQIIKMLLDFKACADIADEQGNIPLYMEFYRNSEPKAISYMVSKIPAKMNFTNDEGLSYFHIACTTNNINQVKEYLESGLNINSCVLSGIYSGYTALHFAALHNQKDVVELLLEKNAQVNIKTEEFQVTALHLACEFNYAKFCRKSHSTQDKDLFPLDLDSTSNRRDQFDIISLLLLHGADVNAKDYQGITPLFHACMTDKNYCKLSWSISSCSDKFKNKINKEIKTRIKEIANKILSAKTEVNVHLEGQESILHIISKYKSTEDLVKLILTKGIDIDTVDDAGLTPLHVAVKASNFGMVTVLLDNKANVNIKCKNSKIPLHGLFCAQPWSPVKYKIEKDEKRIFNALVNSGSDVNIVVGEKCKMLLSAAIERRHNFMVRQLLNNYANVNVEDSCVSSLFEWENIISDDQKLQTEYAEVFQIVCVHVQKLKALGLHISDKVWKCCIELYSRHEAVKLKYQSKSLIDLDDVYLNCTKELEELKTRKIDNDTSLYSILLKNEQELSNLVKGNFIEIAEKWKQNKDFRFYKNFVEVQFRRALIRSTLLPTAKKVLSSLIKIFNINLPESCCDMIVQNLNNVDLANLKAATLPKKSLKRKLNDTESEAESKQKRKVVNCREIQEAMYSSKLTKKED